MDSGHPKNRRGIGYVTANACTECRKKRAKCDGQNPCGRCASLEGVNCVYEVPTRQSKDEMRREILQLRSRQRQIERILSALSSQENSDPILHQLRSGEALEAIGSRLRNLSSAPATNVTTYPQLADFRAISHALEPAQKAGNWSNVTTFDPFANAFEGSSQDRKNDQSQPWTASQDAGLNDLSNDGQRLESMNWISDPSHPAYPNHPIIGTWQEHPLGSGSNSSRQLARSRGQEVILGDRTELQNSLSHFNHDQGVESWTTVTSDVHIVEHLLALYFCWEYPTFASLSKEHFMEDFRGGNPRYCSSLLVNALLALGCRFSDQPIARANPDDTKSTGDHFFAEAMKLLEAEEDHRILTTIQAIGVMSIREASCGRVKESLFLSGQSIRLAVEMGLHLEAEVGDEDDTAQNLAEEVDDAVRQATFWGAFSLDEAWALCTGSLPHFSRHLSLALKPAILKHVEVASWVPYTDDGSPLEQNCVQPSNIRSVYKTFCELSEIIHHTLYTFYAPGSKVTSRALLDAYSQYIFWYDTIPDALRLGHNFTPSVLFSHLYYHLAILLLFRPFIEFSIIGSDVSPLDNCDQASRAISAIMKSYSELYTLTRTPSFVTYFVLASTTYLLALFHHDVSNAFNDRRLSQSMADLRSMSSSHGFADQALEALRYLRSVWGVNSLLGDEAGVYSPSEETLISMKFLIPIIGDMARDTDSRPSASSVGLMQGIASINTGTELEKNGFRRLPETERILTGPHHGSGND